MTAKRNIVKGWRRVAYLFTELLREAYFKTVQNEESLPYPQHFRLLAASVGMLLFDDATHSLFFGKLRDARSFVPPMSILQRTATLWVVEVNVEKLRELRRLRVLTLRELEEESNVNYNTI